MLLLNLKIKKELKLNTKLLITKGMIISINIFFNSLKTTFFKKFIKFVCKVFYFFNFKQIYNCYNIMKIYAL